MFVFFKISIPIIALSNFYLKGKSTEVASPKCSFSQLDSSNIHIVSLPSAGTFAWVAIRLVRNRESVFVGCISCSWELVSQRCLSNRLFETLLSCSLCHRPLPYLKSMFLVISKTGMSKTNFMSFFMVVV